MGFFDFEYAGKRKQTLCERFLVEVGARGAMVRLGDTDQAAPPKGQRCSQAVPTGNNSAHSPTAERVLAK